MATLLTMRLAASNGEYNEKCWIYKIMSAGTEPVAHTNNFLAAYVNVSGALKVMDTG